MTNDAEERSSVELPRPRLWGAARLSVAAILYNGGVQLFVATTAVVLICIAQRLM